MAILTSGASRTRAAHWYQRDGSPCHTMPKAKGDGERQTTLRDARKLGLLPSVTNVLGILDKPMLTEWKIKEALYASLSTPKDPQETPEYWAGRVMDTAHEQVEDAADLGSRVHKALEAVFKREDYDPELEVFVAPVCAWIKEKGLRVVACERRVVNQSEGYAGTVDVEFEYGQKGRGVLDYKTKRTKPGQKIDSYPDQKMQTAAYASALFGHDSLGDVLAANVFISTTEPGRMEVIKHDGIPAANDAFLAACELWRYLKQYDPRNPA